MPARANSSSGLGAGRAASRASVGPRPVVPISEEERVRAAVTVALDEAMPKMVELITREVLRTLREA